MNGRALLLVDADSTPERYRQIASICARLSLDVECMLMRGAALPDGLDQPAVRFAVMPAGAIEDMSLASDFLAAFTAGGRYRLIYGSGAGGGRLSGELVGALHLIEAAATEHGEAPPGGLALEQTPRGAATTSRAASHAAFLPPPLPRLPRPHLGRATYIGWVGSWNDELRGAWDELARVLCKRKTALPSGLLLAGEGVAKLRLPSETAPVLRISEEARFEAARRASGLAVLPVRDPEPYAADLSKLLGAGVPVLTLADCAARFKQSWRLPVARDIEELALRVAEASPPSTALQDATDATLRAFEARLRHAEDALTAQLHRQLARRAVSRR